MAEYTDAHARSGIDAKLPPIETWPNQYADYEITVEIPEYNAICPKTELPDFGQLTIRCPGPALPGAEVVEALHRGVSQRRHLLRERRQSDPRGLRRGVPAEEHDDHRALLLARRDLLDDRSELSAALRNLRPLVSLELQQPALPPQPSAVAVERPVRGDDAMAGHDDRHRVAPVGVTGGPHGHPGGPHAPRAAHR